MISSNSIAYVALASSITAIVMFAISGFEAITYVFALINLAFITAIGSVIVEHIEALKKGNTDELR